jgi:hypothetical protein
MHCKIAAMVILCGSFVLAADAPKPAQNSKPPEKKVEKPKRGTGRPTDKKFAQMDFGPYLATTASLEKGNNIYKGILIPLNKEKTATYCFDTEMLRSAAWTGNFLHFESRAFVDDSNEYSYVDGDIVYQTQVTPGWSATDKRDDPRPPTDPARGPDKDGPLPRSWGRYNGLYVNGDKIVLSYTVGETKILELPAMVKSAGITAITRTFNIAPRNAPLTLLVREEPRAAQNGTRTAAQEAATCSRIIPATNELEWNIQGNRTYLKIPAGDKPIALKLVLVKQGTETKAFDELMKSLPPAEDLAPLFQGGPAHWTQPVITQGELASAQTATKEKKREKELVDAPYVIDVLTAPENNPYKSWLRFTAFDFFPDGKSAAVCTWNGDVWIVSGINESISNLTWKRFATGLHQPMGLKIIDGHVYCTCRDQITRLTDLNNDGEADFYENFNNDCPLTTNFHEFDFDLQTDKEGNLYYAKGSSIWAGEQRPHAFSGSVVKVSSDGATSQVLCHGLRAPNGVTVSPQGWITTSDNQGNWVPLCCINFIQPGKFYGYIHPGYPSRDREAPIVWIPMKIDNSTAGQAWVPPGDNRWGPLAGQMIAVSYGGGMEHIMMENVDGQMQGGAVKFNDLRFPTGLMRTRFNPADGQLYVCGLHGWSSGAPKDCQFARVRYTGKPLRTILAAKTTTTGMEISFTCPIDAASVSADNVAAEQYNVVRTHDYGSGDFSVLNPKKKGHDPVEIKSAKLLPDGKTVALEIPGMHPVTNFILKFNLKASDGGSVNPELSYTINRVPK